MLRQGERVLAWSRKFSKPQSKPGCPTREGGERKKEGGGKEEGRGREEGEREEGGRQEAVFKWN